MDDKEKYLFDLQGFITVANALSADQLAEINSEIDKHIGTHRDPDAENCRFGSTLSWGSIVLDQIDNHVISPYLAELLGSGFRLDHDYIDVIRGVRGPIGHSLHGGGTPFDPAQYYRFIDGRFYNGLTVVAYNLHDVGPMDGGFACVPGSHKANLRLPAEWRDLDEVQPIVKRVTGPAGTAIIFTEALTHGTLPWHGAHERRTLFLKFSPQPLSWTNRYYRAEDYEGLSDRQCEILLPPSSFRPTRAKPDALGRVEPQKTD